MRARVEEEVVVVARAGAGRLPGGHAQPGRGEAVREMGQHRRLPGVHRGAEHGDHGDVMGGTVGARGDRAQHLVGGGAGEGEGAVLVADHADRLDLCGGADAGVLLEHTGGQTAGGREMGGAEVRGDHREELVGGVAAAVGDDDLVAGEEDLAAGDGALQTLVVADLRHPGEQHLAGLRDVLAGDQLDLAGAAQVGADGAGGEGVLGALDAGAHVLRRPRGARGGERRGGGLGVQDRHLGAPRWVGPWRTLERACRTRSSEPAADEAPMNR